MASGKVLFSALVSQWIHAHASVYGDYYQISHYFHVKVVFWEMASGKSLVFSSLLGKPADTRTASVYGGLVGGFQVPLISGSHLFGVCLA